jgi:class 3 adenylate cyclase/tetratricopeptide (TPR) repeat protein
MTSDPYLPYVSRVPLSFADSAGTVAHWLDGTLLFVDVAGFTALSERLGKTGRAGAEELTGLLDGAFARLLAAAYENGGSLLSFGGDALLLFFEGPDHHRRAAHAAGVIRRKPAELGPLQTTVGAVRLKLSMGAHSGRYLFLVSGEDSRVVLLLGPDVTATVRLEQRATAGQVMLGPSLAAAVPEAAGPLEDGASLLLRTPRPPLVGDPHPYGDPLTPAARFLAPALRSHISAQPTSEHRPVAVGFVRIQGTDALLERDELGTFEALGDVVVTAQRAAAEYGACLLASDVDADGAKLILVAGAPIAGERSEERLLRTCRQVLDLDTPLQLRAGVTSGHVFVGDVGPSYRRAFTVMGERVNLAARLMASGEAGELRTTPKVLAASATSFEARELEPLRLKGIGEPVRAVAVGAAIGQVHKHSAGDLIGRDAELELLRGDLEAATTLGGRVVDVVGDPGSGKTSLLTALVEKATCPALRAGAVPYEVETAFGLIRRVLRHVIGVDSEADPAEVGRRLSDRLTELDPHDLSLLLMAGDATAPESDGPLPEVVQDELLVTRLARAVVRALDVLVPGPGLLVIEDLQWSDPSSLALLHGIADQLSTHPWLLCVSRRPQGAAAEQPVLGVGRVLPLGPLDEASATELVDLLTEQAPLSPARISDLVARSGGNPLFLTELVRLSRDSSELPESVEAVVNARLDALPGYLRRMLRQAAVLGPHFDLDLLNELAGFVPDREEWRLLDGLLRRTGSRGDFVSEMFRAVAYESLPFKERRVLHGQAGRALAARGSNDVELLALHAAQAHDDELTWTYSVEAARRSLARGAHDQAVLALQRALIAHDKGRLGEPVETGPVQELLGDALLRAGKPQQAVDAFRRARSVSPRGLRGDPNLCHKEALARIDLSDYVGARRWLRTGLTAATEEADLPARLRLLESQAGVMYRQGLFPSSLRTLELLVGLTEGTEHLRSNAHAHDLTHLVLSTAGDPRSAEHRTQSLAIYESLGDVQGLAKVHNNLGVEAYLQCRWDDAVEHYKRSLEFEEQDANEVGAALSDANIAEVLIDQGRWEEARTRLVRALRTFQAQEFGLGEVETLKHLALLEARVGTPAAGEERLVRAREVIAAMGAESLVPDLLAFGAEVAVLAGDLESAEHQLADLATRSDRNEPHRHASAHLAGLVLALRDDPGAADALRRAADDAEGHHPFRAGLARHALAKVLARSGDSQAPLQLQAALTTLGNLGVVRFRDPVASSEPIELPQAGVVDLDNRPKAAAV